MKSLTYFLVVCGLMVTIIIGHIFMNRSTTASGYIHEKQLFTTRSTPGNTTIVESEMTQKGTKVASRRHIIINSYMRSGSSFFGTLLGFHSDSFYWFELFWLFTRWGYIANDGTFCDSRTCQDCKNSEEASAKHVNKVLTAFFDCDFSQLTDVLKPSSVVNSGPLWKTVECNKNRMSAFNPQRCLQFVEKYCRAKRHHVAKILRASIDIFTEFLNSDENVVLIQLFRDPRAVINSRLLTGWYGFKDNRTMFEDAKCLCSRMQSDYDHGMQLQTKHPRRFMFVIYEDLLENLPAKLNKLFEKIGMNSVNYLSDTNNEIQQIITKYNASEAGHLAKGKDYTFWWRSSLSWESVHKIDHICRDFYRYIGYKSFITKLQFSDPKIPSVQVLDKFKL